MIRIDCEISRSDYEPAPFCVAGRWSKANFAPWDRSSFAVNRWSFDLQYPERGVWCCWGTPMAPCWQFLCFFCFLMISWLTWFLVIILAYVFIHTYIYIYICIYICIYIHIYQPCQTEDLRTRHRDFWLPEKIVDGLLKGIRKTCGFNKQGSARMKNLKQKIVSQSSLILYTSWNMLKPSEKSRETLW